MDSSSAYAPKGFNQGSSMIGQRAAMAQCASSPIDSEIGQQRKRCVVALEMMDESLTMLERRLRPVLQSVGETAGEMCGASPTPNLSEIAAEFYGIAGRAQDMAARVRALLDALALD